MKNKLLQPTDELQIITPTPDSQFRLRACEVCESDNVAYVLRKDTGGDMWQAKCFHCGHNGPKDPIMHNAQGLWNWGKLEGGA